VNPGVWLRTFRSVQVTNTVVLFLQEGLPETVKMRPLVVADAAAQARWCVV
jgi:hypothetical protein